MTITTRPVQPGAAPSGPGSPAAALGHLDLIAAAVLTAVVALSPFAGWGTPGDSGVDGLLVGAAAVGLAAVMLRRGTAADIAGLPVIAIGAWGLGFAPTVGGFAPYLFLPALAGYLRGPRAGFAAGVVAAAAAGTVGWHLGPWVPFQVLGAAWLGATAGLAGTLARRATGLRGRLTLAGACLAGGYLYGILLNATVWTGVFAGAAASQWGEGVPLPVGLAHFAAFYATTALLWDTLRGLGLAVLAIALPWPLLRRLRAPSWLRAAQSRRSAAA
jgi:energy-coupling factor transport system substrate-specific component